MPRPGVYVLEVDCGGVVRFYIGSSCNTTKRGKSHFNHLRKNEHCNRFLQRAWNKYGEGSFSIRVLVFCESDQLLKIEQEQLDSYILTYGESRVFNILKQCVFSRLGVRHRGPVCKVLSEKQTVNWTNPQYRESQIQALKEAACHPEVKELRRDCQLEAQNRPETVNKKSAAAKKNWELPEYRNAIEAIFADPKFQSRRGASLKKALGTIESKTKRSWIQKLVQNRPEVKATIANTNSLPETKLKRSKASTKAQASVEYREMQKEIQLVVQNRSEVKINKSVKVRVALAKPESKKSRAITNALPEVRARRSAAARACHERRRLTGCGKAVT